MQGPTMPSRMLGEPRRAEPRRLARDTKAADWRRVVELARGAFQAAAKTSRFAAWLAEALVQLHGFAGLRDGCRLLRELIDRFWTACIRKSRTVTSNRGPLH